MGEAPPGCKGPYARLATYPFGSCADMGRSSLRSWFPAQANILEKRHVDKDIIVRLAESVASSHAAGDYGLRASKFRRLSENCQAGESAGFESAELIP